jgi:ligand-binding sensor domain-containing protein/signal transduction histidine kinase
MREAGQSHYLRRLFDAEASDGETTAWWVSALTDSCHSAIDKSLSGIMQGRKHRRLSILRLIWSGALACFLSFLQPSGEAAAATPIDAEYHSQVWRREQGLPDNTILAIKQTSDGYLWLGTRYGLCRFDGQTFTTFSHLTSKVFTSDKCICLTEGADGSLWIGTENGLLHRNGHNFKRHSTNSGLWSNRILALCTTKAGEVLIGTEAGLNRVTSGRIEKIDSAPGSTPLCIRAIHEDARGQVWIGTDTGLYLLDRVSFALSKQPDPHEQRNVVGKIESLPNGDLWVMLTRRKDYGGSLVRFRKGGWDDDSAIVVPNATFFLLAHARDGQIWLQGDRPRIARFNESSRTVFLVPEHVMSRVALSFCEDRDGTIWLGTEDGGLVCLKKRQTRAFTTRDGLPENDIWTLGEGRDGSLWVGSDGGVSRYDNGIFTNYTRNHGLPENNVRSISFDQRGNLWVATRTALATFRGGTFAAFSLSQAYPNTRIRAIRADLDETVWIGTDTGLLKYLPEANTWLPVEPQEEEIHSFATDSFANVWMADFNHGLRRTSSGQTRLFKVADGLMSDSVLTIFQDSQLNHWIGTANGLSRLVHDGKGEARLVSFKETSGWEICSMLEDAQGFLWASTTRGLYRLPLDELNARVMNGASRLSIFACDDSSGLPDYQARGKKSQPAACRTRDGCLWFATAKGLVRIEPGQFADRPRPPGVAIEQVRADNRVVLGDGYLGDGDCCNGTGKSAPLWLPPGTGRTIEFHFTAIALAKSPEARFRFRLAGYDKDWQEAGSRKSAFYTNLRPGHYAFEVAARTPASDWNMQPASLAFVLEPFWHQTWWFKIGSVCSITMAGLAIHAWRLHHARQLQELRHRADLAAQRNRATMLLHDDLGSDLTQIGRLIELSETRADPANGSNAQHLRQARQVTDRAKAAIGHLMWALKPECDTLESLANQIVRYADEFFAPWDMRVRFDIPEVLPEIALSPEDRNGIFLAVKETFNNIARHSRASEVRITLSVSQPRWSLLIEDDGCGFATEKGSETGNGLRNVQSRVNAANGAVRLTTSPGKGTQVCFEFQRS